MVSVDQAYMVGHMKNADGSINNKNVVLSAACEAAELFQCMMAVNQKLEEAEQQLQNRTIQIAKAGSIAEAAMELNHVFASAQKAADEYLNSVHAVNEEAEQYAKRIRKEAEEEALAIRAKTEEETELLRKQTEIAVHAEMEKMKMTCQEMLAAAVQKQKETEEACQRMAEEAEQERKQKWDAFEKKCGAYMRQHQELATLLQSLEAYTGGNT